MLFKTSAFIVIWVLFAVSASAEQPINARLPEDARIDPILVLVDYILGPCRSGEKHPLPDSVDYKNCKNFPIALVEQLEARGFDVKLEVFDPVESENYFKWRQLQESKNPERYILRYTGTVVNRRSGTVAILSLSDKAGENPQDKQKGRASLGTFSIKERFWVKKETIGSYGGIERSVLLADVAGVLVNTLEARCATAGFLKRCVDRLPLDKPR